MVGRWVRIGVVGVLLAASACSGSSGGGDDAKGRGAKSHGPELLDLAWSTTGVPVVSKPAVVKGRLVAYVAKDRKLFLAGFDPETGKELWRRPATASYLVDGAILPVDVHGDQVVNMAPRAILDPPRWIKTRPAVGNVVEGVDPATGQARWTSTAAWGFTSPPFDCASDPKSLCADTYVLKGGTDSWYIDKATGKVRVGEWLIRNRDLGAAVFEAVNRHTLGLADPKGKTVWERPEDEVFGGNQVSPDNGWWFRKADDGTIIGWLGAKPGDWSPAGTRTLPVEHTVGLDSATGRTLWMTEGDLYCGRLLGGMQLRVGGKQPDVRCRTTGTARRPPSAAATAPDIDHLDDTRYDADVVMEGFDPRTGKTTWSLGLKGLSGVYDTSRKLWRMGPSTFAARLDGGTLVAVDVATGRKRTPKPDEVAWCSSLDLYDYVHTEPMEGVVTPQSHKRLGDPYEAPCQLDGTRLRAPARVDEAVGLVVGRRFVWIDDRGMHAAKR